MIVGVVGVRSQWVGGGDPLENWNLEFCRVLDGGLVFAVGGWSNDVGSFVRVDDGICDECRVGAGDPPLENWNMLGAR